MRFSVIIPVYNVAPYLRACLDSVVLAAARVVRNGNDVEVFCVDDGSTDGCSDLLDGYVRACGGIPDGVGLRVIHQANAGVAAARNRGLDAVSGDWILFVDGDDFVRPTWLETVCCALRNYPSADLVGFGKMPFYGNETWPETTEVFSDVGIDRQVPDALVGSCVYQFAYAAALVAGIRFPPLSVGEDLVYAAGAYAAARRCVVTARPEYGYRYRADSATHTSFAREKLMDVVRFNVEMFRALDRSGKRIGEAFSRGRGDEWLVSLPRRLLAERGTPGGRDVLEAWFDSLSVAAACTCLPSDLRTLARRVARRRSPFAIRLFCLLPAWFRRRVRPFIRRTS